VNILLINLEFDCAGVSWQLRNAINKYTPHKAVHIMRQETMAAKQTDRKFKVLPEIYDLLTWADVLHFNQWIWTHRPGQAFTFYPVDEYKEENPFEQFLKHKKVFFHFHGGYHQLDPSYWIRECSRVGAKMFKCDPYTKILGAKWMPNILDFSVVPFQEKKDNTKIAIMGSRGDNRRINALIEDSFKYLQRSHHFTYKLFHDMDRYEALRERSSYGITIDNTTQGFIGMWGWESLLMGQALISNFDDGVLEEYSALGEGGLFPAVHVLNIDDVARNVRHMLNPENQERMLELQREAHQWMLDYYNPERLVEKYVQEYAS
jgi:hypothetical protein